MVEGTTYEGRGPSVAEDPALGLDRRAKMEILIAILLALFLGALDQTIVGTALPKIVTELGGNDYYTWVVTIYLLTSTITVPFYGKLSDIYGRKPLLMIGITLFLIGSALSGLSQNMFQLILFRGIQGIGAGALFPIALAVIGDLFTPAERGKYQGLFGAVFGISFIVGPALGGFLTDSVSWHWVFYVNLPVGLVSLYIIWRLLPTIKRAGASRTFDYLGAGVFTVAHRLPARRPDEQACPADWTRLLTSVASSRSASLLDRPVPLHRVTGEGSRSCRSTCGATGRTRPRCSRRSSSASGSSARSSSCRAGSRSSGATARPRRATSSSRCSIGLIGSSIVGRAHRVADRSLQGPDHRRVS